MTGTWFALESIKDSTDNESFYWGKTEFKVILKIVFKFHLHPQKVIEYIRVHPWLVDHKSN